MTTPIIRCPSCNSTQDRNIAPLNARDERDHSCITCGWKWTTCHLHRPTRHHDDAIVQGNYGQGWEDVFVGIDDMDARARLKEYNENETMYPHRLIHRRLARKEKTS